MSELIVMGKNMINGTYVTLSADIDDYILILSNEKESIRYEWTVDNIVKLTELYKLSPLIKKEVKNQKK